MDLMTAKVVSMVTLGVGSFIVGVIPAWFSPSGRQRFPLSISSLLCFGGGVLFATSVVHMLPEARENLPKYGELAFCCGFFLVYLVDEIVHCFYGNSVDSRGSSEYSVIEARFDDDIEQRQRRLSGGSGRRLSYGSIGGDSLLNNREFDGERNDARHSCCRGESNPRMCHVSHAEPCRKTATGRVGLLAALLLHSVLEGLAIGLQDSPTKVILLFGAVASHKLVVGFCLGVELAESIEGRICAHIIAISVFSLGSVLGIGIGMFIDELNFLWTTIAMPVLQALAAGTLLYVTVSEVLPRERARWHQKPRRGAGLCQFVAVACGFLIMYLLNTYVGDDHTPKPVPTVAP